MSSYKNTVEKLPEPEMRGPCRTCQSSVLIEMLSQHGGMCLRCFEAYCLRSDITPGFRAGSKDTPQQAAMRRRVKHGAVNVLKEAA